MEVATFLLIVDEWEKDNGKRMRRLKARGASFAKGKGFSHRWSLKAMLSFDNG